MTTPAEYLREKADRLRGGAGKTMEEAKDLEKQIVDLTEWAQRDIRLATEFEFAASLLEQAAGVGP